MRPTLSILLTALLSIAARESLAQSETATPTATPEVISTPESTPVPEPTPQAPKADITTGAIKLKLGGVVWPVFRYDLTEGAEDKNEFDVSRAYLSAYPTVADNIDGRITIELTPQGSSTGVDTAGDETETTSNTTGSLVMRLKFGWVSYHPITGLDLNAGMVQTPWIAYEEELWGYRLLNDTAAAQYWGLKSADIGYGAKLKVLNNRLFVWSQVQNGETYAKRENNKYKELQTLVSFQILPRKEGGLKAAAFYSYGLLDQDADKVRAIGMLSWQSSLLFAEAGYLSAQTGDGAGTHVVGGGPWVAGWVNVPFVVPGAIGTRAIARVDMVDPDTDLEDDAITRLTAGAAIRWSDKTQVVLDYQQESYENSDVDPKKVAFIHWDLTF